MPNELVRLTYPKIASAALRCIRLGAAEYLATVLTALEMSGLVWFESRIGEPTNSRNGHFPGASFPSNSASLFRANRKRNTPNSSPYSSAFFFANVCWEIFKRLFSQFLLGKHPEFRSHTVSNACILPVGNTPYRNRHNIRTICIKYKLHLCSLSWKKAYIHGNLFFGKTD